MQQPVPTPATPAPSVVPHRPRGLKPVRLDIPAEFRAPFDCPRSEIHPPKNRRRSRRNAWKRAGKRPRAVFRAACRVAKPFAATA